MCDWLDIITSFAAMLVALAAILQVRISSRDKSAYHLGRLADAHIEGILHSRGADGSGSRE